MKVLASLDILGEPGRREKAGLSMDLGFKAPSCQLQAVASCKPLPLGPWFTHLFNGDKSTSTRSHPGSGRIYREIGWRQA